MGVFLGVASEGNSSEVDETEAKIRGAAGARWCLRIPGCDGCAKAMALGEARNTVSGWREVRSGENCDRRCRRYPWTRKKGLSCALPGFLSKTKQITSYTGIADCNDLAVVQEGTERLVLIPVADMAPA